MKIGNRKSEVENPCVPRPSPALPKLPSEGRTLDPRPFLAFTLIELIIVIAIIGILTSLIFPVIGAITKRKQISVAQTQLQALQAAIDGYKTKLGYYPPDNTNNPVTNQLFFELMGTTNNANISAGVPATLWETMDNSAQITSSSPTSGDIVSFFYVTGLANTSTRAHSDDQGAAASTFLTHLRPDEVGVVDPTGHPLIKILVCSVPWPSDKTPPPIANNPALNPWRYISTHPTNNTSTYDLWVDVVVKGKTNRVCNWSTQPIQL